MSDRRLPRRIAGAVLIVAPLLLVGCGGSGLGQTAGSASPAPVDVPLDCTNSDPCKLGAGTYDTGTADRAFKPGMTVTLPRPWSSHSLNLDEFSFYPPTHPGERLFFWEDMVAVKSSGPGHGTTILRNVAATPKAIMSWLVSNPDFRIVAPPAQVTSVDGLAATRIVLGVSPKARYGDSQCPANPRCADLFVRRDNSEYYSIGGAEQVRIDIAPIKIGGRRHTLFLALDAPAGHAELKRLTVEAAPILSSVHFHTGVTAG